MKNKNRQVLPVCFEYFRIAYSSFLRFKNLSRARMNLYSGGPSKIRNRTKNSNSSSHPIANTGSQASVLTPRTSKPYKNLLFIKLLTIQKRHCEERRAERSGRLLPCGGTVILCSVDEVCATKQSYTRQVRLLRHSQSLRARNDGILL